MRDPYLFKDSDILRNIQGIKDEKLLSEAEMQFVIVRALEIDDNLTSADLYSIDTLKTVHKTLFGDVYEWAGEFRTINIQKCERVLNGLSVEYCDCKNIANALEQQLSNLKSIDFSSLSNEQAVNEFCGATAALWQIHPFREGNTRAIILFMTEFAKREIVEIDSELLRKNASFVRDALVMASIGEYAEPQYLQAIMAEALFGQNQVEEEIVADNNKYSIINGYDVSSYYEQPFETDYKQNRIYTKSEN